MTEDPLDLFNFIDELRYGSLHFHAKPEIGCHIIVGVHNLKKGPAIGGTRFIEYDNSNDAIFDVMRLARGMTYKAAISGLPHGGGKAVVIRPKGMTEKQRVEIFEEFGKFIETLGGRYVTCEDSGTNVSDMNVVKKFTNHVLGYDPEAGSSGDPSPLTALGVRRGIESAVKHRLEKDSLEGIHVAIQGVGHVGYYLAKELHEHGAKLTVCDLNEEYVSRCEKEFGAKRVAPRDIFAVKCDVFAPCALGAIINDETLPYLECKIVAGAANNQLLEAKHGKVLHDREILYAPDYAINAGGLINVAVEYAGYDEKRVNTLVNGIYDTMDKIFTRARRENLPPEVVSDKMVEEEIFGDEGKGSCNCHG